MSIEQIERDAVQEFRERIESGESFYGGEPHDAIHEVADGAVPVYTGDLMELAAQDIALATDEPEIGPAFDGSPTPVNIVAANVYERITAALWEFWNDEGEALYNHESDDEG